MCGTHGIKKPEIFGFAEALRTKEKVDRHLSVGIEKRKHTMEDGFGNERNLVESQKDWLYVSSGAKKCERGGRCDGKICVDRKQMIII